MSIMSRIKSGTKKTIEFTIDNATTITLLALTVAGYALLSRLNALDFENQAQNKLIDQLSSDLEDLDREVYDHPRHVEKNEDGTYSVTRLKKRLKTEDPS